MMVGAVRSAMLRVAVACETKGQPLNQAVETIDNVIRKQDSNPRNRGRVPQSTAEPARLIASAISTHRPY